jgi:hypothetical protein
MHAADLLKLISKELNADSLNSTSYVTQVLYKYSLRKLYDLIANITNYGKEELRYAHDYNQLKYFLAEFYDLVQYTNALPLHSPNSGISKIMLQVALILENYFTNTSYFELLMPSIQVTDYEVSGTSLRGSKLSLNHFVMSDDNTHLIEVLPCLQFSSEDGILKHTCLFNGMIRKLSKTEEFRVINHSKETREYWQALKQRNEIKLLGNSFGAHIYRLANDLRAGGEHADRDAYGYGYGNLLDSGVAANVGILNFFIWYDALCEVEQEYLCSKKSKIVVQYETLSLKEIFERLRRPNKADFQQTKFCVEILAHHIDMVLEANLDLFDNYPNNDKTGTIRLQLATTAVANAEFRLSRALQDPMQQQIVTATYANFKPALLLFDKLMKLRDLRDYVGARTIENMRRYKNTQRDVSIKHKHDQYRARQRARFTQRG